MDKMNAHIFIAVIKVCNYKVEIHHTIVNILQMLCLGSYSSPNLRFIPSVFLTMRFNQKRFFYPSPNKSTNPRQR